PSDLPDLRPRFDKVAGGQILDADISPSGAQAVFEAHGEILTVPAAEGDVRNLTDTPGVAERDPAWSPDGLSIAYFSDESGENELHVGLADDPRRVPPAEAQPPYRRDHCSRRHVSGRVTTLILQDTARNTPGFMD